MSFGGKGGVAGCCFLFINHQTAVAELNATTIITTMITPARVPGEIEVLLAEFADDGFVAVVEMLETAVETEVEDEAVELRVEVEDRNEEEELVTGAFDWSAFKTQFPSGLQVYPYGQQLLPHVGRVPVSAVVLRTLSGYRVLFCRVISQGIVSIV